MMHNYDKPITALDGVCNLNTISIKAHVLGLIKTYGWGCKTRPALALLRYFFKSSSPVAFPERIQ